MIQTPKPVKDFTGGKAKLRAHLNELVAQLNSILDITGDGLIQVARAGRGWALRLNVDSLLARIPHTVPANVFPVIVTKDAGVSGGAAAECTWTYTVKALDDSATLKKNAAGDSATGMTPQVPRLHYVAYWYAGETRTDVSPNVATSRLALACRLNTANKPVSGDLGGDLRLLICFGEMPKSDVCP